MSIALGAVTGPMLGGIIYEKGGYRWVFGSGFILVGLDFVLRLGMVEGKNSLGEDGGRCRHGVDEEDYLVSADGPGQRVYGTLDISEREGQASLVAHRDHSGATTPLLPSTSTSSSTSISSLSSSSSDYDDAAPATATRQIPKQSPPRHPILTLLTTPRMLAAIMGDFSQSTVTTCLESILPLRIKVLFGFNSMQVCLTPPLPTPTSSNNAIKRPTYSHQCSLSIYHQGSVSISQITLTLSPGSPPLPHPRSPLPPRTLYRSPIRPARHSTLNNARFRTHRPASTTPNPYPTSIRHARSAANGYTSLWLIAMFGC